MQKARFAIVPIIAIFNDGSRLCSQIAMIPDFDEKGNLPQGIYFCNWEEFKERFGITLRRQRMVEGLQKAMESLKAAGCRTIYIDGSFVTSKPNPNDFDACWDIEDVNLDYLIINAPRLFYFSNREAQKTFYRGELFPTEQPIGNYGVTSIEFFQQDRQGNLKGIIAIDLMRWES